MIHQHIETLNELYASLLPKDCETELWTSQLNGLAQLVWSSPDKTRRMLAGGESFLVRNDNFDLQTAHVIDRIRKQGINNYENPFDQHYRVECSWIGISTKLTASMLAMAVFETATARIDRLEAVEMDNDTERVLTNYWGIERDKWGQSPHYNAWRVRYQYTLPSLSPEELYLLEGIESFDPVIL